ncbi:MAG: Jag N-terminal domain-containing protein [Deltaproteobacteria bacterium]|nr:Jag N-terminal domain-containing protein [Deltaproteobacteria bacterium]
MDSYEFEGKTAEEAINNASRELNIPAENLEFDIIEPGSAGIFGLVGTRKTKIRVTIIKDNEDDEDDFNDYDDYDDVDDFDTPAEEITENAVEYGSEFFDTARDALDKILKLIPVETTVKGTHHNNKISLVIEGDTSGLLIGRKGKTLDALQYIVNKITNKNADKKIKVIIDSENYRQRRVDTLTQMALKIGNKVKKFKKPFSTSPLNPHDRRIVHLALKNVEKLETRSRGEGLHKRVVVFPKKNNN